jgi:hypothetical protein
MAQPALIAVELIAIAIAPTVTSKTSRVELP